MAGRSFPRSGQVSFEFLLVFGWVLLIVVFIAGGLVFAFAGEGGGKVEVS